MSSAAADVGTGDEAAEEEDDEEAGAFCFSVGTSLGAAGSGKALDNEADAEAEAEAVGEATADEDTGRRPIGDCDRGDDVPLLLLTPIPMPLPTLMGRVSAKRLEELSSLALPESRPDDDDDDDNDEAEDDEEPPPLMSSCVVSLVLYPLSSRLPETRPLPLALSLPLTLPPPLPLASSAPPVVEPARSDVKRSCAKRQHCTSEEWRVVGVCVCPDVVSGPQKRDGVVSNHDMVK